MNKQVLLMCLLILLSTSTAWSLPSVSRSNHKTSTNVSTDKAAVPLEFEQERPYVDVVLRGPSGKSVRAHFWLDTGGGAVIVSGPLARKLGLKSSGKNINDGGDTIAATNTPAIQIGGMPLALKAARTFLVVNNKARLDGTDAQGALPLRTLRNYQVVLDYPNARLTIAKPGALSPEGQRINAYFSNSGFISVTASVAGEVYGFLLDSGGQYCMVSQEAMNQWRDKNPQWPSVTGAYGPANMMLGPKEASLTMLQISRLKWGPFDINNVGAVSRPTGIYERMMSKLTEDKVIGSIGGNVLRQFRVDIDYPSNSLYLKRLDTTDGSSLEIVGITIEPSGRDYVIAGVLKNEKEVRKGDRLLGIGGVPVSGLTTAELIQKLTGKPGEVRVLTIERNGKRLSVNANVVKIL